MAPSEYGGAAWGGSSTPTGGRGGDAILVPGFDAAYYAVVRGGGTAAWGGAAWGGRRLLPRPAAGLFAVPDPAAGAVTIPWWWSHTDTATITRLDPDGTRVPVRDGAGMTPAGPSRTNPSSNPVARNSTEGYTAAANTTLSRQTGRPQPVERPDAPVTTAVRATATAAGQVGIVASLDPVGAGSTALGFSVRTSATPTSLGVSVAWYDGQSALVATRTYPVAAAIRTAAATGAQWAEVAIADAPDVAVFGVLSYIAGGLPAGGWLEVSTRISEPGAERLSGPWFDGDSLAAAWVGAPGLSHSARGAVATLVDAEAPLDTDLVYELTSAAVPGWAARSEPVHLPSDAVFRRPGDRWRATRRALLTHPGQARTIPVWITDVPATTRGLERETFALPGRRRKVVVAAEQRSGDEGEITIVAETLEEEARLLEMLDDGSPLLLRTPPRLGMPRLWWLSFGDLGREPHTRSGLTGVHRLTLPFVEVDRPAVATRRIAA